MLHTCKVNSVFTNNISHLGEGQIFPDIILLLLAADYRHAKKRAIKKLSTGVPIWVRNSCIYQGQEKNCAGAHTVPDIPRLEILLLQEYHSTICDIRSKWLNRFFWVYQGEINQWPGWHIPGALVLSYVTEQQKHESGGLPGNKHNCVFAWKPTSRAKAFHY